MPANKDAVSTPFSLDRASYSGLADLAGGEFADDVWKWTLDPDASADASVDASADASGSSDTETHDAEADAEAAVGPSHKLAAGPLCGRWSRLCTRGERPGGSFGHAAAADPHGRHMWVSGGFGPGACAVNEPRDTTRMPECQNTTPREQRS